jgi:hypothetical protein
MSGINNGGSTDYYKIPEGMKDLQDIIELKGMNFSQGNIFKAIFRAGEEHHSSYERDLHKIIFFADRELKRIERERKNRVPTPDEIFKASLEAR